MLNILATCGFKGAINPYPHLEEKTRNQKAKEIIKVGDVLTNKKPW